MSRRISIAILASALLLAGLAGTVVAGTPACPAESTTDLWDISQGAAVTTSTGQANGTIANMFGQSPGPFLGEPGVAFFDDGQADGFVQFVEWSTVDPVLVTDFHLLAAHDGNSLQRAFSTVSIYGWNSATSTFDLWFSLNPNLPYGDGTYGGGTIFNNLLDRCATVPALVTDRFRAEFTQEGGGPFGAPRVVELDAFGSVVQPSTPLPSVPDAATIPPAATNPAVTVGAVLLLLGGLGAVLVLQRARVRNR